MDECNHEWRELGGYRAFNLKQCNKCKRVESYNDLDVLFG